MQERFKQIFIGVVFWWILLLPFDYHFFNWFFKSVQYPIYQSIKELEPGLLFETDTYGTYLVAFFSLFLGALISPLVGWICRKLKTTSTDLLKTVLASVLFFFLFSYGWNKVVKLQFYQPEPNIVYTPFGFLSKDIAYWSVVGSSYSYTVALGYVELLAALLLIFKRTQFLASLLCIAVFGQVVLVNFSFDISVKLLSISLLVFSCVYSAMFQNQWKAIFGYNVLMIRTIPDRRKQIVKRIFIVLVLAEVCLPSLLARQFNDDNSARLAHHGAYKVIGSKKVKRLFIHRQKYLVLQLSDDRMVDYELNTTDKNRYITKYRSVQCLWRKGAGELVLQKDTFDLKPIAYKELPLLKSDFHWFSDDFH